MKDHLQPDHSCDVCKPLRPANSGLFGGPVLGRREFFQIAGTGVAGSFVVPMFAKNAEAQTGAQIYGKARNLIYIHMQGAPSHTDTFDLKVGSWTPADFTPDMVGSGVLFPKGLMPTLATQMQHVAIIRSVRAPALVHGLQQIWTQIARNPTSLMGKISPNVCAVVAREFEPQRTSAQRLPGFVSLNGGSVTANGYFNARYSPFAANGSTNGLGNLTNFAGQTTFDRRFQMLQELDGENRGNSPLGDAVTDMDSFYGQSRAMMYNPEVDAVFRLTAAETQRYGVNNAQTGFGNACLTARNLLKSNLGTRAIQISIGGWDNHTNIYAANGIYNPARQFDKGVGELLRDLSSTPGLNGGTLLDETLVVWMGEFGRTVRTANNSSTPGLNGGAGRDHFFQHFVCFAGGGVSGGRAIGETTSDGFATVNPGWSEGRPIVNEDIAATIYSGLGIDYTKTLHDDPYQRGFEYVPFASQGAWKPVKEIFQRSAAPERPKLNPRKR
ncbi:MAG: DUF1501 domain-containing protein [Acidobacteriota bacterium]|nr:DUF1501 domain-containing protein [Acidobacteriota bacterium]